MLRSFALALTILVLAGCQTMSAQEATLIQAQITRPTIKMECPPDGCQFSKFEYFDPNTRIQLPTNVYDVANNLVSGVGGLLSGALPYWAIAKSFKYMRGDNTTTTHTEQNTTTSDSNNSQSNYDYKSDTSNTFTRTDTRSLNTQSTSDSYNSVPQYLAAPTTEPGVN